MNKFFKEERKSFKKEKCFSKKALKTAVALPLVAGGILVGTKLLGSLE